MFRAPLLSIIITLLLANSSLCAPLVLFDDSHAQRAGNADWTIHGGYSDMADAARFLGCRVAALKSKITKSELAEATIFVSPEPNSVFKEDEKKALRDFIARGGKLFLIADHDKSDRNRDGIDSIGVINQLSQDIGVELNRKWFSEHPITGEAIETHPVMEGVVSLGTWGGTSLRALDDRAQVLAHDSHGGGYIALSEVGKSRIVVMGDSSPFDDGSGNPKDKLHDGWSNPGYTHERLAYNAFRWLLGRPNDRQRDIDEFGKSLTELSQEEKSEVGEALERSLSKHQRTIGKIKRDDVKKTWQEDMSFIIDLQATFRQVSRFSTLYSEDL